ncbi:IS1380 family transposase [Mycobacterium sp. SM1]|uniref:IS1380 family transposase n=1 Tax=Mycobacterium sp. SM1 TaxID=2816243 RepID=UPI001BCFC70B|nr:IS1380 family transposase [Mycobacterium sp. SM1]MBS4730090.1 IS1380 family transposase [Mycobacterium sp. SM1]
MVNASGLLFDVDDVVLASPKHPVPHPLISAGEDELTPVAGVALWGPLLDRLGVVGEADRRGLRLIGPGGYSGGQCYRALTETLLAGGDFLSDRVVLADPATTVLRGTNPLPSVPTLWRFVAGADLGRVAKAGAVNRVMLRRAWAAGAAPEGERLTIDPDATRVATYGAGKQGSAFSRTGQSALSPLVGVCGETGDVLALRARGGAANDGPAMGSFIDECVSAIPAGCRDTYRLWPRVDSAGYQQQVIEAAERHGADYSVTVKQYKPVAAVIHALATDPHTVWAPAKGQETDKGSQIAETTTTVLGRRVRLIVRRQPKQPGEQLAFDDLDGWRLHAIITNVPAERLSAAEVEAHHRLRGGIPEDTIRALKNDLGMIHAPARSFFGNWLSWQAAALAHNIGCWLRALALPRAVRRARGKRLRLAFLNVAARLVRHGRRLHLRFAAAYPHVEAFATALPRIRALPAFG